MHGLITVIHFILCIFLILVILLQAGKGAEMGAAFGGASQTVFGGRGPATFLSKLTAIVALLFIVTSITLAHFAKDASTKSVLDRVVIPEATEPIAPAPVEEQKNEK